MMRVASVIVGCRPQCAMSCSGKSGALPYTAMPGRIQSARTGACVPKRRLAALLDKVRSPGRSRVIVLEHRQLVGDAPLAVGVAEVGHQRDLVHLRQRVQPGPGGAEALRREAQPVHAGVHLEEHAVRLVRLVHGEHVDLLVAVHRVPQVQARAQLQVARLEDAFQQQDGPAPAQRAHPLGLVQVEQGEAVGAAQALPHPLDAVAVGIGLDDAPDLRVGRGPAHAGKVVAQRVGVDGGLDGAWAVSSTGFSSSPRVI